MLWGFVCGDGPRCPHCAGEAERSSLGEYLVSPRRINYKKAYLPAGRVDPRAVSRATLSCLDSRLHTRYTPTRSSLYGTFPRLSGNPNKTYTKQRGSYELDTLADQREHTKRYFSSQNAQNGTGIGLHCLAS